MATIRDQYRHATLHLQSPEVKPRLDDNVTFILNRWKLYGYSKQATIGDCHMPMPEADNAVLKRKWDAWSECSGLSLEQAMKAYVQLVMEIDPSYQPLEGTVALIPGDAMYSGSVSNTGILYKQRDHFKGFRPRKFVLQNSLLSYFIEEQDSQPKKTVDISGSKISQSGLVTTSDLELCSFTLSHPNMLKAYTLACPAADLDTWLDVLQRASNLPPSLPQPITPGPTPAKEEPSFASISPVGMRDTFVGRDTFFEAQTPVVAAAVATIAPASFAATVPASATNSAGSGGKPKKGGSRNGGPSSNGALTTTTTSSTATNAAGSNGGGASQADGPLPPPVNPEETLRGIPPQFAPKIEAAVERLVSLIESPGWEQMYEEDGMVALQKPGSILCVRGDIQMPFGICPIFDIIMDTNRNSEINPQVASARKNQTFSPNTATQHLKFKPVWPTSARDMVNMTHWRMLPDQRIIIISFAEHAFDDANPLDNGVVRAELLIGGYVLTPVGNGSTKVKYVVQSDLKGSIPSSVSSFVARGQPRIVLNIRTTLDKASRNTVLNPLVPSFSDLLSISNKYIPKDALPSSAAPSATTAVSPTPSAAAAAAAADASNGKSRPWKLHLSSSALHPLVLFLPSLLYYMLDTKYRNWGFVVGVVLCVRFFKKWMLGDPVLRRSGIFTPSLPPGRVVVRFPVDLGKVLRYVDTKHKESGVDITLTHVAIKAAASTLQDFPYLAGYMMGGELYPSRSKGVDISVSVDTSESESVGLLLRGVEGKPLHLIAHEMQEESRELQLACAGKAHPNSSYGGRLLALLPTSVSVPLANFFAMLGRDYGLDIEALGALPFPLGSCSIITAPHKGEESIDLDINLSMIPTANAAQPPVVITIGGVSIRPTMDAERRMQGVPVLNMTVSIDSCACSLVESRKFCAKFQQYMSTHPWEGRSRGVPTSTPLARK